MDIYEREKLEKLINFTEECTLNAIKQIETIDKISNIVRDLKGYLQGKSVAQKHIKDNPNILVIPDDMDLTKPEKPNIDKIIEDIKKKNISAVAKKGGSKAMALLNIKGLVLGKNPRKDGRYMGRFLVDGKYRPFYARTYEDLELKALDIVKGKKKFDKFSHFTYRQWALKWLETYHKKKVTENVYKNNCAIFKNHIFPNLANKALNRLTGFEIQEVINNCPFSRQRQIVANLLTASLKKAYQLDIIKKDITKAVEKPSHTYKEGKALTREEEKRLLEYLKGHELEYYIILLLNSGLRRNEGLGLQWKHLDFEKNIIIVEQQVNLKNEITKKLKTKTSKRIVKMFPMIKKYFQPIAEEDKEKRIFLFDPYYVSGTFKDVCKEVNIKNYSIKGNRTTFATRCAEMGIADKVTQAWLGHSKLDTTVNTYQKVSNDFIEQEFKKVFDTDFDTDL